MAKNKAGASTSTRIQTPKKKNKGVHSKTKTSKTKTSALYKKAYKSQGR